MAEHPLLFSGPMVRALLDGSKTMTRRAVSRGNSRGIFRTVDLTTLLVQKRGLTVRGPTKDESMWSVVRPRIEPGDTIWVRETHAILCHDGDPYCPCDPALPAPGERHYAEYRADVTGAARPGGWPSDDAEAPRWRPGIYMPRWASRITLRVTAVYPRRALDISSDEVKREGVTLEAAQALGAKHVDRASSWFELWRTGWEAINGKASFDANPWCWVYEFEVVR